MAGQHFEVIFRGVLQAGSDPAQVRGNIAKLFKTEPSKVEHLFSGQAVVIKKGIDQETARQYQAALAKAGALVEIRDAEITIPAAAPTTAEQVPQPLPHVPATARAAPITVPPAMANRRAPPEAPAYSVAEPGVLLVEAVTPPAASIDTAHLTVAAAGELLVEPIAVAPPAYDLSALALAPAGSILSDAQSVAAPEYDLSALKLE